MTVLDRVRWRMYNIARLVQARETIHVWQWAALALVLLVTAALLLGGG